MKKYYLMPLIFFTFACGSHNFTKTGLTEVQEPKPEDCEIKVFNSLPEGYTFEEIGLCKGRVPGGGMVADYTHKAIEKIKQCACENGGDAILLKDEEDKGYTDAMLGYSQQTARAAGVVYKMTKK